MESLLFIGYIGLLAQLTCNVGLVLLTSLHLSSHLSPLTLEVVGAPQMTLQQYLSILFCLPLPLGNLQTQFPSIPFCYLPISSSIFLYFLRGARWLSGRVSDSGARGPGFETYRRRVVSLSKTLYSPKVLVNYTGSDGSVPT